MADEQERRDDATLAGNALVSIIVKLDTLTERERARVLHSLIDHEARRDGKGGYQFFTNFINDRYLLEQGIDSAAEYWRYLASTRSDARFRDSSIEHAHQWGTVGSIPVEVVKRPRFHSITQLNDSRSKAA